MTMVLRCIKCGHCAIHAMPSSFRDYIGETTEHGETVVEQAFAHQVGDAILQQGCGWLILGHFCRDMGRAMETKRYELRGAQW